MPPFGVPLGNTELEIGGRRLVTFEILLKGDPAIDEWRTCRDFEKPQ